ncbi:MAG: hypothetical protein Q7R74_00190 [bacterium]|nr:hypothetical protein [bacterium]
MSPESGRRFGPQLENTRSLIVWLRGEVSEVHDALEKQGDESTSERRKVLREILQTLDVAIKDPAATKDQYLLLYATVGRTFGQLIESLSPRPKRSHG